jgi:hypothetical protein
VAKLASEARSLSVCGGPLGIDFEGRVIHSSDFVSSWHF